MTHKLKALALVAVFAMSAVAASAASAQNGIFTTGGAARTLIGTQTGEATSNSVTAFGLVVICPNAIGTGHKFNVTPHESIPNGATSLTITPHYGLCEIKGTPFRMTIDMNGCDYSVDSGATVGVDEYAGKYTITCPAGQHITWTLFTSAAQHSEGKHLFATLRQQRMLKATQA